MERASTRLSRVMLPKPLSAYRLQPRGEHNPEAFAHDYVLVDKETLQVLGDPESATSMLALTGTTNAAAMVSKASASPAASFAGVVSPHVPASDTVAWSSVSISSNEAAGSPSRGGLVAQRLNFWRGRASNASTTSSDTSVSVSSTTPRGLPANKAGTDQTSKAEPESGQDETCESSASSQQSAKVLRRISAVVLSQAPLADSTEVVAFRQASPSISQHQDATPSHRLATREELESESRAETAKRVQRMIASIRRWSPVLRLRLLKINKIGRKLPRTLVLSSSSFENVIEPSNVVTAVNGKLTNPRGLDNLCEPSFLESQGRASSKALNLPPYLAPSQMELLRRLLPAAMNDPPADSAEESGMTERKLLRMLINGYSYHGTNDVLSLVGQEAALSSGERTFATDVADVLGAVPTGKSSLVLYFRSRSPQTYQTLSRGSDDKNSQSGGAVEAAVLINIYLFLTRQRKNREASYELAVPLPPWRVRPEAPTTPSSEAPGKQAESIDSARSQRRPSDHPPAPEGEGGKPAESSSPSPGTTTDQPAPTVPSKPSAPSVLITSANDDDDHMYGGEVDTFDHAHDNDDEDDEDDDEDADEYLEDEAGESIPDGEFENPETTPGDKDTEGKAKTDCGTNPCELGQAHMASELPPSQPSESTLTADVVKKGGEAVSLEDQSGAPKRTSTTRKGSFPSSAPFDIPRRSSSYARPSAPPSIHALASESGASLEALPTRSNSLPAFEASSDVASAPTTNSSKPAEHRVSVFERVQLFSAQSSASDSIPDPTRGRELRIVPNPRDALAKAISSLLSKSTELTPEQRADPFFTLLESPAEMEEYIDSLICVLYGAPILPEDVTPRPHASRASIAAAGETDGTTGSYGLNSQYLPFARMSLSLDADSSLYGDTLGDEALQSFMAQAPPRGVRRVDHALGTGTDIRLLMLSLFWLLSPRTIEGQVIKKFMSKLPSLEKSPLTLCDSIKTLLEHLMNHLSNSRLAQLMQVDKSLLNESAIEKNVRITTALERAAELAVVMPILPSLDKAAQVLTQAKDLKIIQQRAILREQSQEFFGIKPAFQSPDGWKAPIAELSRIESQATGFERLACLLDTAKAIYSYHAYETTLVQWQKYLADLAAVKGRTALLGEFKPDVTALAADEFFPIFVYVVVHAEISKPEALKVFLLSFCSQSSLQGEGGYYLTVFEAALEYIESFDMETHIKRQQEEAEEALRRKNKKALASQAKVEPQQ